jgi:hypothetical protein
MQAPFPYYSEFPFKPLHTDYHKSDSSLFQQSYITALGASDASPPEALPASLFSVFQTIAGPIVVGFDHPSLPWFA